MSKRASQRQRGWVEFKGLRFAECFMTRKQLLETIHAFFKERGYPISSLQPTLLIRFSQTEKPDHPEHGDNVLGWMSHGWTTNFGREVKEVAVFIRKHQNRRQFIETLFHELDHVLWMLEGKSFDDSVRYWYRLHEVRARQMGQEWAQRLSR